MHGRTSVKNAGMPAENRNHILPEFQFEGLPLQQHRRLQQNNHCSIYHHLCSPWKNRVECTIKHTSWESPYGTHTFSPISPSWLLPFGFPDNNIVSLSRLCLRLLRIPPVPLTLIRSIRYVDRVQIMNLVIWQLSPVFCYSSIIPQSPQPPEQITLASLVWSRKLQECVKSCGRRSIDFCNDRGVEVPAAVMWLR
jgi:hypothetical protein